MFRAGLYHQAIMESGAEGNIITLNYPGQQPENYVYQVAAKLNCTQSTDPEIIACMRSRSALALRLAQNIECTVNDLEIPRVGLRFKIEQMSQFEDFANVSFSVQSAHARHTEYTRNRSAGGPQVRVSDSASLVSNAAVYIYVCTHCETQCARENSACNRLITESI